MEKGLSKGEKLLVSLGRYVVMPVNLQILLDQSERDVLNSLRHCYNMGESYVSTSVIQLMTGLGDKTIRKAKDRLIEMGFLNKGIVCGKGTHYEIDYKRLSASLGELNAEPNPIARIELSKQLRNKDFSNKIIKKYFKHE
jgi:hypothetical protein